MFRKDFYGIGQTAVLYLNFLNIWPVLFQKGGQEYALCDIGNRGDRTDCGR